MKKHIAILLLAFYTLLLGVFELKVFSSGTLLAVHAGVALPAEDSEDARENVCLYNFHEKQIVSKVDVAKPVTTYKTSVAALIASEVNYSEKLFHNPHTEATNASLIRNLCCVYRI